MMEEEKKTCFLSVTIYTGIACMQLFKSCAMINVIFSSFSITKCKMSHIIFIIYVYIMEIGGKTKNKKTVFGIHVAIAHRFVYDYNISITNRTSRSQDREREGVFIVRHFCTLRCNRCFKARCRCRWNTNQLDTNTFDDNHIKHIQNT